MRVCLHHLQPHVLILDEPTNNLDLEAVAALADCVEAFEGGVILVSHDNYFVSRVAKEVWVVGDGAVKKVRLCTSVRTAHFMRLCAESQTSAYGVVCFFVAVVVVLVVVVWWQSG